ncbi:MAG: 30S ribosome-binding factor RbfA [Candidatus Krumholzibacteria bacterium]|nr:30S ribosome-binding factor RbfA [Candidatus Krumholzibacteria bacterium]
MARSYRKERLNESIKELLGELILSRVKDPRVGLVTITGVEVARDLETAKVFFTVMGGESEREESKEGLESAKNYLRKTVGRELKMRNTPDLRFIYDDSLDRSMRIEDTLKQIKKDDEESVS